MKKLDRKSRKLNLNTETVQRLTREQLELIAGGAMRNTHTCVGCISDGDPMSCG